MSSLIHRPPTDSGTRLRIDPAALDRLHAHAVEGFPHEVVGVLAGRAAESTASVAVPLQNEAEQDPARRFAVSGLKLARTEASLEAEGLDVLGYYHSHPDHPASWSDTDRDQALPDRSYVIVSVVGPAPRVAETCAWRLSADRAAMLSETLEVAPADRRCC
jgi:proteasome lid subunit RPN8/RPN11